MTTQRTRLRDQRSWRFDLSTCVLGLALLAWSLPSALDAGWQVGLAALLGVPLIVLVARFPKLTEPRWLGVVMAFGAGALISAPSCS